VKFDAEYYEKHLGPVPCEPGNEVWEGHFANIAARITLLRPKAVIDVGCGFGMLVRHLLGHGIWAAGIDVSPYAVKSAVAPNVKRASIVTWRSQWKFDLATCIEVFEHIKPEDTQRALRNLCRCADDILFSSNPDDRNEETHVHVQPPDYWDAMFASQGFEVAYLYDATFIAPHARRYRRAG
jgi:2-polyprenyl-3-methyl-5-hydroxy-6-metoxy-1,4-benzoquinol methylase